MGQKANFLGRYGSSADLHKMIKAGVSDGLGRAVRTNPHWTPEHTDAALKSEHPNVRLSMAHNWSKLSHEHRDALLRDPDGIVSQRAKVAHYGNMSGDQLMSVLHDPSEKIYHVMAYEAGLNNNRFKDHHIKELVNHPDIRIRNDAYKELDVRNG